MDYGIISVIPVVVMVVGSLITKRMIEMSIISSVLAGILLFKKDFFVGYLGTQFYETLGGDTYSAIFFILLGFGAIIEIASKSGALNGFAKVLGKYANSRKKSLLITYLLQWILFADDYLMTLGSCYSMRTITDENKVPREHLSLMGTIAANNVTSFVPMSSFAVFAIATMAAYKYTLVDYIRTMPYMIGCIVAEVILLLLCVGLFPKMGPLKSAYKRVDEGGSTLYIPDEVDQAIDEKLEEIEEDDSGVGAHYFFIPLVVLIVAAVTAVLMDLDATVEIGMFLALITQFIMLVGKKHMTAAEFFEHMLDGFKGMAMIAFVIFMVCTMADMCTKMGIADFLIGVVVGNVPTWILPAMFMLAVWVVCLTTDGWATIALAVPIMIPMAQAAGIPIELAYGAIISGYGLGVPSCLFCDSLFMASACTGVPNDRELKVNMPYTLTMLIISVVAFCIVTMVVV
ncbi:MAG: Na+/H+ antiporter NhaC family protein [Eubacteriales bacterium]|nr:Na+/H+ antiporter NhaC family protein [Eubacteriales bacterium]